jgi:hypothetical protein
MFPQQGSYGDRCSVSRANGLFVYSYLSQSLVIIEFFHEAVKKHKVILNGAARRRKAYIQRGAAWFTRGSSRTLL